MSVGVRSSLPLATDEIKFEIKTTRNHRMHKNLYYRGVQLWKVFQLQCRQKSKILLYDYYYYLEIWILIQTL